MKTLNLITLSVLIATGASTVIAEEQTVSSAEENYGNPTALFTTLGVSRAGDSSMINFQASKGNNIYQVDYGFNDKALGKDTNKEGNQNYRARAFHVSDAGWGASATLVGSHNADGTGNDALFVGGLYRFSVTDNIMLFPMLDVGQSYGKEMNLKHGQETGEINKTSSTIVQPGLYALYAFDNGNWLYANPKAQYNVKHKEWQAQAEVGGGVMLTDSISVGGRVDWSGETTRMKEDTKVMFQANYYF